MYTTLHLLVWFPNNSSEIVIMIIWHHIFNMCFAMQLNLNDKVEPKMNEMDSILVSMLTSILNFEDNV